MSSSFTSLTKETRANLQAQIATFQQECQDLLRKTFLAFFEACPSVKAIYWNQYTPSFNDGDPCLFCVGEATFFNSNDKDALEAALGKGDLEDFFTEDGEPVIAMQRWETGFDNFFPYKECKELDSFLRSAEMKDAMESTFGNDVSVVATKDGFSIEEYDCGN